MAVPNLFLITPPIGDVEAFAPRLAAALAAVPVAAVLLRGATGDDKDAQRALKSLVAVVQDAGAAAILDAPADARLVARIGADGAHYPCASPLLADALATLKPDRIVGVGDLRTRHEAMDAGEKDIDYLMFGEPRADGFVPETGRTVEQAQWWAEIFNTPCVACAGDLAAVSALAAVRAEFLGLGPWVFDADAAEALVAVAATLKPTDTP